MNEPRILWLPWGREAFQKAKSDDKPVLLDISAVWCHWCHVMDETTYSDPEVADLVMRICVPVKVDRDQRPDIDRRYNMGGWLPPFFSRLRAGSSAAGRTFHRNR